KPKGKSELVRFATQQLMGRYTRSNDWTVTVLYPTQSTRDTCDGDDSHCQYDRVGIRIILRRNPNYQLINLLFPAFLIVVISSFVFIVPPGAGDKMGLSVSILLSLYMFSQLMYDKMPETGTIPLLSKFISEPWHPQCMYSMIIFLHLPA